MFLNIVEIRLNLHDHAELERIHRFHRHLKQLNRQNYDTIHHLLHKYNKINNNSKYPAKRDAIKMLKKLRKAFED